MGRLPPAFAPLLVALLLVASSRGQSLPGEVASWQKVSATSGGLGAVLDQGDVFGEALARLDPGHGGTPTLLVGAPGADDGGSDRGALHVLVLAADGTVSSATRISATAGGFGGELNNGAAFGDGLAGLGDVNGDGVLDVAVGAPGDGKGAVWILLLDTDGTVKGEQRVASGVGGFPDLLGAGDRFGEALAPLGDLDGDGVPDLAVGARFDDDGGANRGAVWILFLAADGTVREHAKLSASSGDFAGPLTNGDQFGVSIANMGDIDGDGVIDLAVGADGDDDGAPTFIGAVGAVWILHLARDGTAKSSSKISLESGGFSGDLDEGDVFGRSIAAPGDLDGDGVGDLAVGAEGDDDGGLGHGSVWVLFLAPDGSVRRHQKISSTEGQFGGALDEADRLGHALAALGDLDGDGVGDLAASAHRDDDGGVGLSANLGAVWQLFLRAGVWADLGGALPGTSGAPRLEGRGTLVGGAQVTLRLRDGASAASVALVVGLDTTNVPFRGGVLVPAPDAVLWLGVTDDRGAVRVEGRWPVGLTDETTVVFQAWLEDDGGPAGYAATNGVGATTP